MHQLEIIKQVYSHKKCYLITLFGTLLIGFVMFYFTHFQLLYHNIGKVYAYAQVIVQVILAILFGINLALFWHKMHFVSKVNSSKEAATTTIASILGIIISGCPVCGITLASYLGLATLFSSLPFFGIELKVIGILLLLYSTNSLAKKMYVCEVDKKKKK